MSNANVDAELDRRLAAQPPQDEGITLDLDHDECCRLMAILDYTTVDSGLKEAYETLAHYFDHHDGYDTYRVTLDDFCIKLGERE